MRLDPPGVFVVTTQTSVYRIDPGALRAFRAPRAHGERPAVPDVGVEGTAGAEGPEGDTVVHRPLFTDGAPLELVEVPEPVPGQRMRLRVQVGDVFLDHASKGRATDMLTTAVVSVHRMPPA